MKPTTRPLELKNWICRTALTLSLFATGCTMPSGVQFRASALPAIQSGVQSILTGVVDGVFAAIAPEPDNADSTP